MKTPEINIFKEGIYDDKYILATNSNTLSTILENDKIEITKIDIYAPLFHRVYDKHFSYNAMEIIAKFHTDESNFTIFPSNDGGIDGALNSWMVNYHEEKFKKFPHRNCVKLVSPKEIMYVEFVEDDKLVLKKQDMIMAAIDGSIFNTHGFHKTKVYPMLETCIKYETIEKIIK